MKGRVYNESCSSIGYYMGLLMCVVLFNNRIVVINIGNVILYPAAWVLEVLRNVYCIICLHVFVTGDGNCKFVLL